MASVDLKCSLPWAQPWRPCLRDEAVGRISDTPTYCILGGEQ